MVTAGIVKRQPALLAVPQPDVELDPGVDLASAQAAPGGA
jgi:hypothetical protein